MRRRLNYTRRKNIPSDRVLIQVSESVLPDAPASFEASIDLSGLDLPSHARVFLDPHVNTSSMRFSYGTVGQFFPPEDRRLTDIDEGREVLFKLLIVGAGDDVGKILASTRAISPTRNEKLRQSLFPLKTKDLGEAIWIVDLESDRPCLVLNNRIPGLKEKLLADPLLRGSVYPHALRMVLRIVYEDSRSSEEVDWVQDWKSFVRLLVGEARARDLDEASDLDEEGIETVVKEFVNRGRYADRFLSREQRDV